MCHSTGLNSFIPLNKVNYQNSSTLVFSYPGPTSTLESMENLNTQSPHFRLSDFLCMQMVVKNTYASIIKSNACLK